MTDQGIPCLSIHDSFIVPSDNKEQLITTMINAYGFFKMPLNTPVIEEKQSKLRTNNKGNIEIEEDNNNNEWVCHEDCVSSVC